MVIDTSVLFDALVDGPFTVEARGLLASTSSLTAPDILEIEIAGALTRGVRRGILAPSDVAPAQEAAARLIPNLEPTAPLLARGVALSLALAHPLFDCLFLAFAEAKGDVLATSDQRFKAKLAGTSHDASVLYLGDWRP